MLANIVRALGSDSIDHRLRVVDFADGAAGATFELSLAQIEKANAVLLVGSNPRHDQPLLNHRIRQASKHGAKIYAINPLDFDLNYGLAGKAIVLPSQLAGELAALAAAAGERAGRARDIVAAATPTNASRDDQALRDAGSSVLVFGDYAGHHARRRCCARSPGSSLQRRTAHSTKSPTVNAVGLARGALPKANGKDAAAILRSRRSRSCLSRRFAGHKFAVAFR